jgi:hypothetical protein
LPFFGKRKKNEASKVLLSAIMEKNCRCLFKKIEMTVSPSKKGFDELQNRLFE